MMIHDTHRFQTGEITANVYEAVNRLLNNPKEDLCGQTIRYYFQHKKHDEYGWCPDAQRRTLAILCDAIICVICLKQNEKYQPNVTVKLYGQNSSLERQCIYIYYNEITLDYYPLFITSDEITKISYDEIVKDLIPMYIKDEIKYDGEIYFDDTNLNNGLTPLENEQPNGHETIPDSIAMRPSNKRKLGDINDILPPLDDDRQLPKENPDEIPNKCRKVTEDATGRMPLSCKNKTETKAMEELIQVERTHDGSDTDEADSPIALVDEHYEEKVANDQCKEDICFATSDLF